MSDFEGSADGALSERTEPTLTVDEALAMSALLIPLVEHTTPAAARAKLAEIPPMPAPEMADVGDVNAGGVAARWFVPHGGGRPTPLVVYFHGGGFVVGNVELYDGSTRRLATALGMPVVSVDYRLAPEHPFPAAVDDAMAALEWALTTAAQDPRLDGRVIVAGDSAGANIAAVTALGAAGRGLDVAHQLLVYPCIDPSRAHPSHLGPPAGTVLTTQSMRWYWDHYLDGDLTGSGADWRVDPRRAANLSDAAPATFVLAGIDPLHDEGAEYAGLLAQHGVDVTLFDHPELFHGFVGFASVLPAAAAAIAEAAGHVAAATGAAVR